MSLFKIVPQIKSRKSSTIAPGPLVSPADPRSQSKVVTSIITPFGSWEDHESSKKWPTITAMPQDSATSLTSHPSFRHRFHSSGPYCPKRPTLREIVANESREPWTLSAFTSYCEANLCAENLSFIQEADRYSQRYNQWSDTQGTISSDSNENLAEDLSKHWRNILSDYIISGGTKELNVESRVRHEMLAVPESDFPPKPEHLHDAMRLTEKLIEDSILFSFLNDIQPEQHSSDEYSDTEVPPPSQSSKANSIHAMPLSNISRPASRDNPVKSAGPHASSFSSAFRNQNPRSPLPSPDPPRSKPMASPAHRPKSMFAATKQQHSSSSGDGPSIDSLVFEDSTAAVASPVSSNAASSSTSNTSPPMSPPPSDGGRPSRDRSDSGWRKIGSRFGFGKKRSSSRMRKPHSSAIDESPPP